MNLRAVDAHTNKPEAPFASLWILFLLGHSTGPRANLLFCVRGSSFVVYVMGIGGEVMSGS